MGLDASVMCNCFRLGLTTEPPVPREWLQIDEEGHLELKPGCGSPEASAEVYQWMQDCCEHPGMQYAWEEIANWSGYRIFQQALGGVGWDRFPVLRQELPEVNGGKTEAPRAALALGELAEFQKAGEIGTNACLVDTATGEVVQEHVAGYEGVFILDGDSGLEAGFDADGFFIRTGQDRLELFRAARFRQMHLDPDADPYGPERGLVAYLDLDSGKEYECRFAVPGDSIPWPDGRMQDDRGRCRFHYPATLHVERRAVHSSDFDYILGPLERIFRASVEMGNPVRWE